MTDNEITKALECCSKPYCHNNKCPLHRNTINTKDCITQLSTNALDLINRQKAEVNGLQHIISELQHEILSYKTEAIKEFAERLKSDSTQIVIGNKYTYQIVTTQCIDNVKKEMVGEG